MIPNPIGKVLSTLHSCHVRYLLMGGQACVFYGAAEFSRDTDIVILADPDLVQAKKTQRDKDWPMVRRLIEAHYEENRSLPNPERIAFWLQEARTPELLVELARSFPDATCDLARSRPLLVEAMHGNVEALRSALRDEEERIRAEDRAYWAPLRKELEQLRHSFIPSLSRDLGLRIEG